MQEGAQRTTHQNGQDLSKDRWSGQENLSRSLIPTVYFLTLVCHFLCKTAKQCVNVNYLFFLSDWKDLMLSRLDILMTGSYSFALLLLPLSVTPFPSAFQDVLTYRKHTPPPFSLLPKRTSQILSACRRKKAQISDQHLAPPYPHPAWLHPSWTQLATKCTEKCRGSLNRILSHVTYNPSNCFSHLACQCYNPQLLPSPTRMSHRTILGCFCIKTDESSVALLVHKVQRAPTLLLK